MTLDSVCSIYIPLWQLEQQQLAEGGFVYVYLCTTYLRREEGLLRQLSNEDSSAMLGAKPAGPCCIESDVPLLVSALGAII